MDVVIGGTTYKVESINAGQMKELSRLGKDPSSNRVPIEDNILTVAYCLQNAVNGSGEVWDVARVEKLPWATYRALLEAASQVSGFESTSGEVKAPNSTIN
jgi:hypothetical protein